MARPFDEPLAGSPLPPPPVRMGAAEQYVGPEFEPDIARMGTVPMPEMEPPPMPIRRMSDTLEGTVGEPPIVRERMGVPYEPLKMREHETDEPRGFWGNVKHRLEHAGKGLLMGGVGGAALGAISPRMVDRTEHEQRVLPRYNQQWGAENEAFNNAEINRSRRGVLTGIDPTTGQPTETARHRMIGEEQNKLNAESLRQNRTQMDEDRDERRGLTARKAIQDEMEGYSRMGMPVPEDVAARWGRPELTGKVIPRATPEISPYQQARLRQSEEASRRAEERENRADVREQRIQSQFAQNERQQQQRRFEGLRTKLNEKRTEREKRAGAVDRTTGKGVATQEELDALDKSIKKLEQQVHDNNPAKMAKRARKAGGQAFSKDPRIGKTFRAPDGRRYKITGIDSDGEPIGTPTP